jgi:hypothetical protein
MTYNLGHLFALDAIDGNHCHRFRLALADGVSSETKEAERNQLSEANANSFILRK